MVLAFLRDLRYAVRSLSRSPALTAALLATVAIGIGTHATVGGFINGLLTRNLALPDASRLASIYWRDADRYEPVPYQSYLALRQAAASFDAIAAFRESRANVTVNGHWSWLSIAAATPDLWPAIAVEPALGRMTFADEGHDSSSIGVVIAYRIWRGEFRGSPDVIGSAIVVEGRSGHIVGVAPEWFEGLYMGRTIDAWVPLDEQAAAARKPAVWILARLKPDTTPDDAQGQVTEITGDQPGAVVARYTGIEPEIQLKLTRLQTLLGWAAALVFLTAAANLTGLLLSRASRRTHETATRIALGASRARLASHVAADGVVVSLGGAALGVMVAFWTAGALPALLYAEDAERLRLMPEAWQVLASAASYAAIMLCCSLAPIAQIDRRGTMTTLRRTGEGAITPVSWMRSALVVAQMSVCVILVVGAALLFEGFREALHTARGGQLGEPIMARLEPMARYARPTEGQEYYQRAEREIMGVLGVRSVAWVGTLPGGRPMASTLVMERPPAGFREVVIETVTPRGEELVALTMKSGRPFAGVDGPFSCPVAIVNQAAADEYFDGRAVGQSMRDGSGHRIDIVGVAEPVGRGPQDPRVYFYERQALQTPSREVTPRRFTVPVRRAAPESVDIDVNAASSDYFTLVGATFAAGRGIEGDIEPDGCRVAVVNRAAARTYFDGDAVGGAVVDLDGSRSEVVGVVDTGPLRVMQRRDDAAVFFPMAQRYLASMTMIVATAEATPELVADIGRRLAAVPGGREPPKALTLEEHLARTSLGPERIATLLVSASALIALALALLGVYGVMSDAVLQKKREIALKLALGAHARAIIAGVFRDGLRIAAVGGAAGVLLSWTLVQWVVHANAGFHAPSLWIWLACPLVLLTIVAIASILPARWALAVDPLVMTREQ